MGAVKPFPSRFKHSIITNADRAGLRGCTIGKVSNLSDRRRSNATEARLESFTAGQFPRALSNRWENLVRNMA